MMAAFYWTFIWNCIVTNIVGGLAWGQFWIRQWHLYGILVYKYQQYIRSVYYCTIINAEWLNSDIAYMDCETQDILVAKMALNEWYECVMCHSVELIELCHFMMTGDLGNLSHLIVFNTTQPFDHQNID